MNKKIIMGMVTLSMVILIMLSINVSAIKTKLPIFENGRLIVSKPGYYPAVKELTTGMGVKATVPIELEPFRYKNVVLKKYNIIKNPEMQTPGVDIKKIGAWGLVPKPVELRDDEEALISITKINNNPYEEDLFNVVRIFSEEKTGEIKLVPGTYEIEISLYYKPVEGSILVPQDEVCNGWGPWKKCVTIPEIRAPSIWPLGSVKYKWDIKASDLKEGNTLEFYGVSLDIPGTPFMERKHSDLENLDKINDFIKDYSMLRPRAK